MRSTKGGLIRRVAAWGVPGAEPPDAGGFQKFCKKSMKNKQFLKKISRKFRDFLKNSLKYYRIFGENLDKNLDKNVENLEICISKGFGGEAPEASKFMEI